MSNADSKLHFVARSSPSYLGRHLADPSAYPRQEVLCDTKCQLIAAESQVCARLSICISVAQFCPQTAAQCCVQQLSGGGRNCCPLCLRVHCKLPTCNLRVITAKESAGGPAALQRGTSRVPLTCAPTLCRYARRSTSGKTSRPCVDASTRHSVPSLETTTSATRFQAGRKHESGYGGLAANRA